MTKLTVDVNFVEVEHPREGAAHGGKKPGEFAPKEGGSTAAPDVAKRLASAHQLPEGFELDDPVKKYSITFFRNVLGKLDGASYAESFDSTVRDSLRQYTGDMFFDVNDSLRHPGGYSGGQVSRIIHDIDTALKKAPPLQKDVVVWRGMQTDPENVVAIRQAVDSKTPVVLQNEGYTSTSLLKDVSLGFTVKAGQKLVIKCLVPKGTKAVYMQPMSSHEGEMELLLNRNSKLRVISMEEIDKTHHLVTTELESPEADELKKAA